MLGKGLSHNRVRNLIPSFWYLEIQSLSQVSCFSSEMWYLWWYVQQTWNKFSWCCGLVLGLKAEQAPCQTGGRILGLWAIHRDCRLLDFCATCSSEQVLGRMQAGARWVPMGRRGSKGRWMPLENSDEPWVTWIEEYWEGECRYPTWALVMFWQENL